MTPTVRFSDQTTLAVCLRKQQEIMRKLYAVNDIERVTRFASVSFANREMTEAEVWSKISGFIFEESLETPLTIRCQHRLVHELMNQIFSCAFPTDQSSFRKLRDKG